MNGKNYIALATSDPQAITQADAGGCKGLQKINRV